MQWKRDEKAGYHGSREDGQPAEEAAFHQDSLLLVLERTAVIRYSTNMAHFCRELAWERCFTFWARKMKRQHLVGKWAVLLAEIFVHRTEAKLERAD